MSETGMTTSVTPKIKGLKTANKLGRVVETTGEVDVLTQNLSAPLAQSLVERPEPSYAYPEHSPSLVYWRRSSL